MEEGECSCTVASRFLSPKRLDLCLKCSMVYYATSTKVVDGLGKVEEGDRKFAQGYDECQLDILM